MVSFVDRADTQFLTSQGLSFTQAFAILERGNTNPYESDPQFLQAQQETEQQFALEEQQRQLLEQQRQEELQRQAEAEAEAEAQRLLEEQQQQQAPPPEDPIAVPEDPIDEGVPMIDGGLTEPIPEPTFAEPTFGGGFFRAGATAGDIRRRRRGQGGTIRAFRTPSVSARKSAQGVRRIGGINVPSVDSIFDISKQENVGFKGLDFSPESIFGTRRTRRTTRRRTQLTDPTDIFRL